MSISKIAVRRSSVFRGTLALGAVFGLALAGAGSAQAQTTPQFFFTLAGQVPASSANALTSLTVGASQQFTLSVWYQFQPSPSVNYFLVGAFVGFDQATSLGTGATPLNNEITLGLGLNADTAVTNINNGSTPSDGHNPEGYTKLGSNQLGGGQDPNGVAGALRPYGVDVQLQTGNSLGDFYSGTGPNPVRLFDITLRNAGIGAGGSETVTLYSTGNGAGGVNDTFNTFLDTSGGVIPVQSTNLTVFQSAVALPEPGTLPLILCALPVGAAALSLARRRRGA